VLELEKLDAMIHVRRVLLEKQPLAAGGAQALEREIEALAAQREHFADLVAEARGGRGVVAASFDEDAELAKALNEMFEQEVKRAGQPPGTVAKAPPPAATEGPTPFDEAELGRMFARMFEAAMEPELLDWAAYRYVGRTLGIVDTPQGPRAWYIRTGKGGTGVEGQPKAGDPARIHGFAHLQVLDAAGREIPGRFRKWFMKPPEGRMGVGNQAVYAWLQERAPALGAPSAQTMEVARTDPADTSDLRRLNDWLRSRGITPGEGEYQVGDLIFVLDETEYRSLPTAPAFLEIGDARVPLFVEEGGIIWRRVPCRISAIP
jgi:hypothetical protein